MLANFSVGLVIYWTFSNILGILQQYYILREVGGQDAALDILPARRIVADVEEMREAARRSRNPEAGTVRLGIFPTLGPYLLPHVVPGVRERFHSIVSRAVSASGRNVRPFATAFAFERKWNPASSPAGGTHTGMCFQASIFCCSRN